MSLEKYSVLDEPEENAACRKRVSSLGPLLLAIQLPSAPALKFPSRPAELQRQGSAEPGRLGAGGGRQMGEDMLRMKRSVSPQEPLPPTWLCTDWPYALTQEVVQFAGGLSFVRRVWNVQGCLEPFP